MQDKFSIKVPILAIFAAVCFRTGEAQPAVRHAGLKTISPSCEDSIYLGIDLTLTNDYCSQKCLDNGGVLAQEDTECKWNPAIFTFQGDTQVEEEDCFSKITYGFPNVSGIGKEIEDVTPAQCQTACQKEPTCIAWEWFIKDPQTALWSCVLKGQAEIEGAIATVFNPANVAGNEFCPEDVGAKCVSGEYDCLTCSNRLTCVYSSFQTYSGWKYCSQSGKGCIEDVPEPSCDDATYYPDEAQNNDYCADKCTTAGGLDDADAECSLNPPDFDDDGHVIIPDHLHCYTNWVYGSIPTTPGTTGLTPAQCQGSCQAVDEATCFAWIWQVLPGGTGVCSFYTADAMVAALGQIVDGTTPNADEAVCPSEAFTSIAGGLWESMECYGLNKCVYKMDSVYSGFRYCASHRNPCDLVPIDPTPTPTPACVDAIYLGTDLTKSNKFCRSKCELNGGSFAADDTECMLHPPSYDPEGNTVVTDPDCFSKYIYGLHAPDTTGEIGDPLVLTPAECQSRCQTSLTCVAWSWERTIDGQAYCSYRTEEEITATIAFDVTTDDETICAQPEHAECASGSRPWLTCEDVPRCIYELGQAYSGWKYCAFPRDVCSGAEDPEEETACGKHVDMEIAILQDASKGFEAYVADWNSALMTMHDEYTTKYPTTKWAYALYRDKITPRQGCEANDINSKCYVKLQDLSGTSESCLDLAGVASTSNCPTYLTDFMDQGVFDSCEADPKEMVYDGIFYVANRTQGLTWSAPDSGILKVVVVSADFPPHEFEDYIENQFGTLTQNTLDGSIQCDISTKYVSNSSALAVLRDQKVFPVVLVHNVDNFEKEKSVESWKRILVKWGFSSSWVEDFSGNPAAGVDAVNSVIREMYCGNTTTTTPAPPVCVVPSADVKHCNHYCKNVGTENGKTVCLDYANVHWVCQNSPQECCQNHTEITTAWGDVTNWEVKCAEQPCIIPSDDLLYCNRECVDTYPYGDKGKCADTDDDWVCMNSTEDCCVMHIEIQENWAVEDFSWFESCKQGPCYVENADAKTCAICTNVADGICADNGSVCQPSLGDCCLQNPKVYTAYGSTGTAWVFDCINGGSGETTTSTVTPTTPPVETTAAPTEAPTTPTATTQAVDLSPCRDLVYIGGPDQPSRSNRGCMDACVAGGGVAAVDELCSSQPAMFDDTTGETYTYEEYTYEPWNFGYQIVENPTGAGYSIVADVTPAECQAACQEDEACYAFTWERTDAGDQCALKSEDQIMGAIVQPMNTAEDVVDPVYCPADMPARCFALSDYCLSCTGHYKCVQKLRKGYSGWKWFYRSKDVCTGDDFVL